MAGRRRVGAALAYIEALAPGRPMFVEEPVPPGETGALAQIAAQIARCRSPPASGSSTAASSTTCSAPRAVDIVQPDICHCGGLLEAKKIAAMAEAVSVGRRAAQSARADRRRRGAAFRRLDPQPRDPGGDGRARCRGISRWCRARSAWSTAAGRFPSAPGLGIEVDEGVAPRHPFQAEIMHTTNAVLADGTVVDW